MDSKDIEKIQNLGKRMRQINSKFKLLNLLRLAKEEYDKSQYENCIKVCEEALKINPNDSAAYRGLGCSMQSMGDFEKAEKYVLDNFVWTDNMELIGQKLQKISKTLNGRLETKLADMLLES